MTPPTGRNEPCPCGSGQKFKKCCGTAGREGLDADALMRRAAELHKSGQAAEAVQCLKRALTLRPESPEILHGLALLAGEQGHFKDAAAWLNRATRLAPDNPALYRLLADALLRADRPADAIEALEAVARLTPTSHEAHYNLGTALKAQGRALEALPHFERAIALSPQDADSYNNLGNTLAELGRTDEALAAYESAVHLAPSQLQPQLNLATALQNQGQFEGAWARYQAALAAIGPKGALYRGLTALRRFTPDQAALIEQMEDYRQQPGLPDAELADVAFALGKVYDDVADYPRAFENYHLGNSLLRRQLDFHQDEQVLRAERVMQTFTRDFLAQPASWRDSSLKPVFIVGMPRSGTSLVEQIIASHPAVHGAGELDYWRDEDEKLFPHYRRLPKQAQDIAQRYLQLLARLGGDAQRVTDKLPGNFWHLGLIHAVFPNARIIHCKRNPVDTCLSIYFQKFFGDHPYAYDLDELACYYRLYRRLTRYWKSVLPEQVYTEVQYEDLVAGQEAESRRLIEFIGLEWSERCLGFHQHQRTVKTASSWQVRQPIYGSSRERWRHYEPFIGPLLRLLNESDDSPSNSPTRPRTPTRPNTPGGAWKRAA